MADQLPVQQDEVNPTTTQAPPEQQLATPTEYGAGIGAADEQGAEVAAKVHRDALDQFNQSIVLDTHAQLQAYTQKTLFDPKQGLLNQNLGIKAPAAVDQTMAAYDAQVGKLAQGLTNDAQRESFLRIAQDARSTVQMHVDGYESRQLNDYHEQVTHATMANAATSAVQDANAVAQNPSPALRDPAARAAAITAASTNAIALGVAAIQDDAKRQGLPPEAVQAKVAEYQSSAHLGVLQSMLAQGRDQDASAYYDAHKGDMVGEQADLAARQVQAGSTAGDAVRAATGLMTDPTGKLRPQESVLNDIYTDPKFTANPRLQEAVATQAMRIFDQRQAAQEHDQKAAFDDAFDKMEKSPLGWSDPAVQAAAAQTSPELRYRLQQIGSKPPKTIPDNSDAYLTALTQATSQSGKQGFMTADLRQYRGQVSDRDFDRLVEMQARMRGEKPESTAADDPLRGLTTVNQIISDHLDQNGFAMKDPKNPEQPSPEALQYRRAILDQVAAAGGIQKLGLSGVQKVADQLMIQQQYTKLGWFGGQTPTPGKRQFQIMGLTPGQRAQGIAAAQAKGIQNPTDQDVYDAYQGVSNGGH